MQLADGVEDARGRGREHDAEVLERLHLVERRRMRRLDAVPERAEQRRRRPRRPRRSPGRPSSTPPGACVIRPMRRRPGSAPTSSRYGRAARARRTGSPGMRPSITSRNAAVSRTVRLTEPSTARPADAVAEVGTERAPSARRLQADEPAGARRECGSSRRRRWHAPAGRCRPRPPPPSRRSSRRASASGPRDCASARTAGARSRGWCRARARWCGR